MHAVNRVAFVLVLCFSNFEAFYLGISKSRRDPYDPPEHCDLADARNLSTYIMVEDFDRCAPSLLPSYAKEYYLATAVRGVTYKANFLGYRRLRLCPKMLVDVSDLNLEVTVLGNRIKFPIGTSPVALQKLASDQGELDTVRAISDAGTLMILSSYASSTIEEVARAAPLAIKWMQTYIFLNREVTLDIVRKAEASGYKAIVVTVDSPLDGAVVPSRSSVVPNPKGVTYANLDLLEGDKDAGNPKLTFADLTWLKHQTSLPIVAKGILRPDDAVAAALHGASGILVSNHGGRQMDYEPATIDALPAIVDALRSCCPWVEVYVDGGVRSGMDVYKALACGARAVFIGRPVLWGLAVAGQRGVSKVFSILKDELNTTMMLSGSTDVNSIPREMVTEDDVYILASKRGVRSES